MTDDRSAAARRDLPARVRDVLKAVRIVKKHHPGGRVPRPVTRSVCAQRRHPLFPGTKGRVPMKTPQGEIDHVGDHLHSALAFGNTAR
jgi:hypothetical protein